jgi:hypothetical protein
MFLIWGVGIPLTAFIILFRGRHKLEEPEIKMYYLMVYQGLKPHCFYWEFVNTTRKISILLIAVLLSTSNLKMKVLCVLTMLIFYYRLQIKLEPYKYYMNNHLERIEMVSGSLTLFGGIIFTQTEDEVMIFNSILFIAIIVVNCYFILLWIYCLLKTFRQNHR